MFNKDIMSQVGSENFTLEDAIPKKASRETERSLNDVLWAGTNVIQEDLELERNIKSLMEDNEDYIYMEKYLTSMSYSKEKIRKKFEYLTGVDPVAAFLDTENHAKPPAEIPRYTYGWGVSKNGEFDYYYIMPLLHQFYIYGQKGIRRVDTGKSYRTLIQAREALDKLVKSVEQSTPSVDLVKEIIQRVSKINIPKETSEGLKKTHNTLTNMPRTTSKSTRRAYIESEFRDNNVTHSEKDWLIRYCEELYEQNTPEEMEMEDLQEGVKDMKDEVENKSFDEIVRDIDVPQEYFDEKVDEKNDQSIDKMIEDAYTLLEDALEDVAGFGFEIVSTVADKKDKDPYTDTFNNAGVWVVFKVLDDMSGEEATGISAFPVIEGKVTFSGKFKGKNNREYGFSQMGFQDYMDDITGETSQKLEDERVEEEKRDLSIYNPIQQ